MNTENTSKILDDVREKIAQTIDDMTVVNLSLLQRQAIAAEILSLSGTTDIECPECEGDFMDCPKCDGTSVIKYPWKVEDFAKYRQVVE